eukprot:CAMPEP_0205802452 /NCGR_PEP_ID=MMETSP0205-20121125/4759_1 /ASSEMBLY_ACC=CAM_ASM_000278 /TAXON_ID=36767 /ORGANISM="Euplotes focardii, Strain TN1" /LENGTH=69 /DNA_ID=CAMNT_0053068851 /DNA_START=345 /DNA_END=554 /DNA_ORIENTATION=-
MTGLGVWYDQGKIYEGYFDEVRRVRKGNVFVMKDGKAVLQDEKWEQTGEEFAKRQGDLLMEALSSPNNT